MPRSIPCMKEQQQSKD